MFTDLKRAGAEHVVVFAVAVGIIVFFVWCGLISSTAFVLNALGTEADIWSMFEGISSAAAFALAVGGGVVILVQINETIDSRNLSVFNDVFQRLMSDEEIRARRWIYTKLDTDDPATMVKTLTDEQRDIIKRVLNTFDYLGFLLEQGWVSDRARNDIVEFVMPIVIKTWLKVGPYVDYESDRRKDPDYYSYAKFLAELCQDHKAQFPGEQGYIFIEDAI